MAPLRRVARPIADNVRPLPYLFLQSMVDGGNQHGMHYYWRSQRVPELTDDVIDVICGLTDTITSPLSYTAGFVMGGAAGQVDPDATAVGERGNGFELSIVAGWPPPDPGGDRHTTWVRQGWTDLRPFSTGVYSHFISDEGAAGVEAAYGERLKRLTALKDRYDPANLFRMNANIPPTPVLAER
jgi:FAD/FMN-containing dehydrogenase